ncbi:Plexin-A1, partial [Fragariocoptes setiger]
MKYLFLLVIWLSSHHLLTRSSSSTTTIAALPPAHWDEPGGNRLLHLTINELTGQVYIGTVNKIYQFSSDLKPEAYAVMGPRPEDNNNECSSTTSTSSMSSSSRSCNDSDNKKLQDYYNKALVIYHTQPTPQLISCGTSYQGACALHNLSNISNYELPANESVVANSAKASTVVFIAPGPAKQSLSRLQPVLYVGASYASNGPYSNEVPAVSSRSLNPESMFSFASLNVASGTRLTINSLARDRFPITYIHGFSSRGFSYFVTVQRRSVNQPKPFISKLIRVCQKDINYHSYVEVPLVCRTDSGVDYNLAQAAYVGTPGAQLALSLGITQIDEVLFVVFAKSKDERDIYNEPSRNSALCIYALPNVHRIFTQNIQHCFNGYGQQGLDFISRTEPCIPTQVQITDDFCGMDVNNLISGSMPIETSPAIVYLNTSLTAVASSPTHEYTVAFFGTGDGRLKRVVVEDSKFAVEYSDTLIDPPRRHPVNPDMRLDRRDSSASFLYVMTDKRVSLVRLQSCSQHRTCSECLSAHDPYCGWCSLENKCSLKVACPGGSQDPLYWLSYKSGKCTMITSVNPPQIQRTTARILHLTIENLPSIEGQLLCAFTAQGKTELTNASQSSSVVTCNTPPPENIPALGSSTHDIVTKLSVRMRQGPDFVATNFTFFDCDSYKSCTECVASPYPCYWCVGGHVCTHDTGENCRNDVLVTGIKSIGPSIRSGPKFCPRINTTTGSSELLVPSGIQRRITVKVEEIPQSIISTRFMCQFNIEGRVRQANAQLLGDTIFCDPMEFSYASIAPNVSAAFAVTWDNGKALDNPDGVHVLVYRCAAMALNCGFCLELPEKYMCGWCQDTNTCQTQDHCIQHSASSSGTFLTSSHTCPDPQILSFNPMSGPYEGGTNITIKGINLGRTFEDISNGVSIELANGEARIGDIECVPFRELYIKTSQITCQVGAPLNSSFDPALDALPSGAITVRVTNDFVARSLDRFSFVNPKILSVVPSKGPKSGGTHLHIWGSDMNAGSHVEVSLAGAPCNIISRQQNVAECITSRTEEGGLHSVSVRFDNGERHFADYHFLYVDDPEVDTVTSTLSTSSLASRNGLTSNQPRGIPAGGITVYVRGKNFVCIQQPRFYVIVDGVKYNSSCHVAPESPNEMKCSSPMVPIEKLELYRTVPGEPIELDYGFFMDNVESVHNLATRRTNRLPMFLMFSNPEFKPFPEENHIKYYKSDYLTINGRDLDQAATEQDVLVRIGNGICNVTSLSRSQLTCRPPPSQPAALNWQGQPDATRLPDVVVMVGNALNFTIGRLSYDSVNSGDRAIPKSLFVIIIVGSCFSILIVIIILIAYKRKTSESNRVVKTMQEQMDILEMKVASEAKMAFCELQTEMTDLTDDLMTGGIPLLDYRIYTLKVLFPNTDDHPVLLEMEVDPKRREDIEKGLGMFGKLIMNKTFLLLFIRTLESNRYFSMRDRVNVASLIMVTLQGQMVYCTDILKTLLADLIEKNMESRSHPKLLLRRTESVAEKMLSSWFTFLLYKFLKENAGEPLFLMYQAIKHQVNKGPVDAITSEARYSLSEEKLIRQQIDYKMMTVYVTISPPAAYLAGVDPNLQGEIPKSLVKVLDCDTISQVKEKAIDAMYKSTPHSQRPCKDNLDIEWRGIIMCDEDRSTKTEGEWRRLNTLAHYKVPDCAQLTLVPRQNSVYDLSYSEKHKYETLNFSFSKTCSPPLSRATSPLNELDSAYKYWHLVRHHDNDYKEGERSGKMVSEIYLTRLLATKGTLQKFVDDLFETIFSTSGRERALPLAIKYMFDFLDDQALGHGITDPEVVHTWKSNSLPLRFWVNLIKNPNFVFDINKSNIVDSCLSVVAQTFMDACSTSEHRLGKDSPSSKLLYAKDIPIYKDWVERYYAEITMMAPIREDAMISLLNEESRVHAHEFNVNVSLNELYQYVIKYKEQLLQTLEEDELARKAKLSAKLQQVILILNDTRDNISS